jgi:hypothetical protein
VTETQDTGNADFVVTDADANEFRRYGYHHFAAGLIACGLLAELRDKVEAASRALERIGSPFDKTVAEEGLWDDIEQMLPRFRFAQPLEIDETGVAQYSDETGGAQYAVADEDVD